MVANIRKLLECLVAVISYAGRYLKKKWQIWLFTVVLLVTVLLCWLCASCSSHHYFSINAEEITNPEIMYSDSTHLYNPF